MGYEQTSVKIVVDVQNRDAIDLLKKQVMDLQRATSSGAVDLSSYGEKIKDAFKASTDSAAALKAQIALFEKLKDNLSPTIPLYAQVRNEIVELNKQVDKLASSYSHVSDAAGNANGKISQTPNPFGPGGERRAVATADAGKGVQGPETVFGGLEFNQSAVNAALDAAIRAENQITEIEKRAQSERLVAKEKAFKMALEIQEKEWADELKIDQQGADRLVAQFDQQLEKRVALKRKAAAEEEAAQAAKAERSKLMENIGLGVGFPLLFGGGPGAIAGGGIGSFIGEGFAGQIIGSAIGAKLDEFVKSAADFAKALREDGDAAGYLKQALGYLDPAVANQISSLKQAGQTAEAAKVAFEETAKVVGEENATALKKNGEAWDQLIRDIEAGYMKLQSLSARFLPIKYTPIFGSQVPKEEPTTQAYRDQLAIDKQSLEIAQANSEAAKTILKDDISRYVTTQKIKAEKEAEGQLLKINLEIAKRHKETDDDRAKKAIIQIDLQTRLNEIERQAADERRRQAEEQDRKSEEAARKAKEEQDKALRLQKDKAQVAAQAYETGIQEFQLRNQALNWARTPLEAAKAQLQILDQVDQKEQTSFDLKAKAMQAEAEIKGTQKETAALLGQQNLLLIDQQNSRRQNAILALAELEYTTKIKDINSKSEINTTRLQGQSTIAGLQSGIAKQFGGNQSFAYDRLKLEADQLSRFEQEVTKREESLMALIEERNKLSKQGNTKEVTDLNKQIDAQQQLLDLRKAQLPVIDQLEAQQERLNEFTQKYGSFFDAISQGMTSTFDLLVQGTDNWGNSLRRIASTVLQDIAKQLLKIYVIDQSISFLKSAISGINPGGGGSGDLLGYGGGSAFNLNANGNVFAANGIVPYAMGGVVDRPTIFPFAKGVGLMGEAGPEAIIPLKRGADGKLGVAGGGGGANVTVNVDAKGTSVQGDQGQSAAFARAVAAAVQAEMIKQKRPGGLLAA